MACKRRKTLLFKTLMMKRYPFRGIYRNLFISIWSSAGDFSLLLSAHFTRKLTFFANLPCQEGGVWNTQIYVIHERIRANPGVHTSHISKMMGHAWRQMTSDDQLPYREKAKDFAESMKNLVCDESSDSD